MEPVRSPRNRRVVDAARLHRARERRATGLTIIEGPKLLEEALGSVDQWRSYVLVRQFDDIEGWELQNMLTVARVMIVAALAREESRGTHLRTDFPSADDTHWNRHQEFSRGAEGAA